VRVPARFPAQARLPHRHREGVVKYRTIVADPPWPYEDSATERNRAVGRTRFLPYRTMPLHEITHLPVGEMAAPGAHLYLWTTNRFLWEARDVMRAWGFAPTTTCVWCKEPMGQGGGSEAFSNTTEWFLWGRKHFGQDIRSRRIAVGLNGAEFERLVRGRSTGLAARWEEDRAWPNPEDLRSICDVLGWSDSDFAPAPVKRWDTTWFQWPRGKHSAKPEAFLDLVEQTSPGPYLEMFARRQRLGWDTWGNEALEHVEIAT
jgi:N6-adenosine-specific RNA methylase IME4